MQADAASASKPRRPSEGDGVESAYATGPHRPPVAAHAAMLAGYASLFGGLLVHAALKRRLPGAIGAGDIALLGAATFEIARVATRDEVTDAIRAPFTHLEGKAGAAEVHERPRGSGLRRAIGELLTCPYCAAPWIAASLVTLYGWNRGVARTTASTFTIAALSDVAQQLYALLRKAS